MRGSDVTHPLYEHPHALDSTSASQGAPPRRTGMAYSDPLVQPSDSPGQIRGGERLAEQPMRMQRLAQLPR